MALKRCDLCGNSILFGGKVIAGQLYCLSCHSQLASERKDAVLREKQEKEQAEKRRNLQLAQAAYRAALDRLKESPMDPDRREKALELGRLYASWTRYLAGQRGVTLYDELALSNEIQAACAAATNSTGSASVEDRLRRLAALKEQDLITDEEFRARRQAIINDV